MEIYGIVCLNGVFLPPGEASVPVTDRGVLYGMGIFETIRVSGGSPRMTERHLSRLYTSAGELGFEIPFGRDQIARMIDRTATENGLREGGLRLTVTAGGDTAAPNVFITARNSPYTGDQYRSGIRAGFSSIRRNENSPLVKHKTLNYFENIMAKREAAAEGWGEALLLNIPGNLSEGSVSNVFLVNRGKVVTPHLQSGILPGVMRRRVIEACALLKLPLEERTVSPGELFLAGECFVTNSLMGVMPVTSVGASVVGNGSPGIITRALTEAIDDGI
ncbi:MAG: aminotransferase class IV [Desulfocucumaceae bacterium]